MATIEANRVVELFNEWLDDTQRQMPEGMCYLSYDDAYYAWLTSGGVDEVACDLLFAVEVLLAILSVPENEREGNLPSIVPGNEHAWEYMTVTGFRKTVFDWRRRQRVIRGQ